MKHIDPLKIKKILFISLSNIGDAILTTPSLDLTRRFFPKAQIIGMVGPRAREIFENHPHLARLIIYDKHSRLRDKLVLMMKLKEERFDLVIDLRNTAMALFIQPRYATPLFRKKKEGHAIFRHLACLKTLGIEGPCTFALPRLEASLVEVKKILSEKGVSIDTPYIVLGPGAANRLKRWELSRFSELAERLIKKYSFPVLVMGSGEDAHEFSQNFHEGVIHLSGQLSLMQAAALLKKAKLFVTNDSGPMHLAAAVDTRVLAIFGPTDPKIYGPHGCLHRVVRLDIPCSPCMEGFCRIQTHECMQALDVDRVFKNACEMLDKS